MEGAAREAQLAAADGVARRGARNRGQLRAIADVRDLARHEVESSKNANGKVGVGAKRRNVPHGLHLHEVEDGTQCDAVTCGGVDELGARADPVPVGAHKRA